MSPGLIAQIACLLEVTARKPGNVHRLADFPGDAHYLDFLLSAAAIVGPMDRASSIGVGQAVLEAVEATRKVVATNTNLGMILLLAPLACVEESVSLHSGVRKVLAQTNIDDARAVYRAIRLANPGGLGEVNDQDLAAEPTVDLLEAMRLASDRDLVARQYATDYADLFDLTLPALQWELAAGEGLELAIIRSYLTTLAARPDSLIARKRGQEIAEEASRRAGEAIASGDLRAFDIWLRDDGHARNPGATADLVAAALFAAIRDGTIELPRPAGSWQPLVGSH
jgi:triphosphoribosyl-dephospho-CoA synthase